MSITPPDPESTPASPDLFRVNPMSYLALVAVVLAILGPIAAKPVWFWPLILLPVGFAWWVARTRTRIDEAGVHLSSWRGRRDVPWERVKGVMFPRTGFARLVTTTGESPRMGGVSFQDLPRLSAVSRGRIRNPYAGEPTPETGPETDRR